MLRMGFAIFKRHCARQYDDERGAVIVVIALLMVVFMGLAALVIDLGTLLVARNELQNASDASALAGLVEQVYYGDYEGEQMAVNYAIDPNSYRIVRPAPGSDAVNVTILGPETMRVQVSRTAGTTSGAMPLSFARVWGMGSADVSTEAVAQLDRRVIGTGPGNLLPFGIKKEMVDANGDGLYDMGSIIDIFPHPWAQGEFGLLDLNGGGNSNDELIQWIQNGYDGFFIIPEGSGDIIVEGSPHMNIEGNPGVVGNSIAEAVLSRVGDRVLFPVFDQVSGQGANTEFRVVDFVGGIIKEARLTQAMGQRYLKIEISQFSASNIVVGEDGTPSNSSVSAPVLTK